MRVVKFPLLFPLLLSCVAHFSENILFRQISGSNGGRTAAKYGGDEPVGAGGSECEFEKFVRDIL